MIARWAARHFGRITASRRRAELLAEARELSERHEVLALESAAIAARANIDQRHNADLAHFYKSTVIRLSATQGETK